MDGTRMIRMTTDFFILTTEYTEYHGVFSLAMRMIPKLLLSSVGTHRCVRKCDVLCLPDAARYVPTIPTKDGKNIKSAVIRLICVICVP